MIRCFPWDGPEQRAKLALTHSAPVYRPSPVRISDEPLAREPNGDNIAQWTPFGQFGRVSMPDSHREDYEQPPHLGAFEVSDVPSFGPSGIGVACGPVQPPKANYKEPHYLGLPSNLWRPFQPQPSAFLNPPLTFAETALEIPAGGGYGRR